VIVYLMTHAHTRQVPHLASREWELSDTGLAQAAALADAPFWPDVGPVVVSSEPKTRLTVEPAVARYGLPVYVDTRFDELRRGGWIEDYAATVRAALANPEESIAGWESALAAQQRALAGLADLETRFGAQAVEIVICGHGISLSLVRAWFQGRSHVDADEWQRLPFGAWAAIDTTKRCVVQDFELGDLAR
jgi:broad specificity phosphatase PhoE